MNKIRELIQLCSDCRYVPVIVGPTGSGKSSLLYKLAEFYNFEIISADSRQIYRFLDIGTAKPEPSILQKYPHHFISIVEPDEKYSAAEFARSAADIISSAFSNERIPVVAGGTGFYIKALFNGFFEGPGSNEGIRNELEKHQIETLYEKLEDVDREAARSIHKNDKKRIMRALEVFMITGRKMSEYHKIQANPTTGYKPYYFYIQPPRDILYERINKRADSMFENGWIQETEILLKRGYSENSPAFEGLGYRDIISYLKGGVQYKDLVEKIKMDTRRYAKRQITWFSNQIKNEKIEILN